MCLTYPVQYQNTPLVPHSYDMQAAEIKLQNSTSNSANRCVYLSIVFWIWSQSAAWYGSYIKEQLLGHMHY